MSECCLEKCSDGNQSDDIKKVYLSCIQFNFKELSETIDSDTSRYVRVHCTDLHIDLLPFIFSSY